jgi:hypothetical protein
LIRRIVSRDGKRYRSRVDLERFFEGQVDFSNFDYRSGVWMDGSDGRKLRPAQKQKPSSESTSSSSPPPSSTPASFPPASPSPPPSTPAVVNKKNRKEEKSNEERKNYKEKKKKRREVWQESVKTVSPSPDSARRPQLSRRPTRQELIASARLAKSSSKAKNFKLPGAFGVPDGFKIPKPKESSEISRLLGAAPPREPSPTVGTDVRRVEPEATDVEEASQVDDTRADRRAVSVATFAPAS